MAVGSLTPRDQLDRILALLRRSLRYAWVAALIGAIGTALAIAFALSRPHKYESSTVILHRELIPTQLIQGNQGGGFGSRNIAQRFREMINAAPLLEKVISDNNLYPSLVADQGMVEAVAQMRLAIQFRAGGGGTFTITYRGSTPEEAQVVTAQIADLLIEWEQEIKLESVNTTKSFLEQERVRALEDVRDKERQLAEFLNKHPEFALSSTDVATGAAGAAVRAKATGGGARKTPSVSDGKLRALLRQRERIKARLEERPEPVKPTNTPESPELRTARADERAARTELSRAERRLEDARARFTEAHPDVTAAKRAVDLAKKRLTAATAEVAKVAGAPPPAPVQPLTDTDRGALRAELASIDRDISARRRALRAGAPDETPEQDEKANTVVALETEWAQMFRQVEEARDRYEAIESKAFTAEIAAASEAASQGSQLTIVDPAFLPTKPAGMGRSILVMAGMVVFGGIGCVVALGLAFVDDRIVGRYDVDKLGLVPVLGVIPKAKKKRKRSA